MLYSLAQRTIVTAAGGATWEIRTDASHKVALHELGLSQVTAVAGTYGLGKPAAIGVNPTTPVTFLDEGDGGTAHGTPGPAATTTACVAWTTTAPTVPTNFNRRLTCAATIGQGTIWTWPRGLMIPVTSSIVLWIIATAPVLDVYATIDE